MSVTLVYIYCSNCGFKRTYLPDDKLPSRCPKCQVESRPGHKWLRKNVPYLPTLAWLLLLVGLSWYGIFVLRANEHPWLPYLMVLAVFSLVWMLTTLFLPWPKPRMGPMIWRHLRWPSQDVPPKEIIGRRVLLKHVEPLYRRKASATIHSYISAPAEKNEEGEETAEVEDRLYTLQLEGKLGDIAKEGEHLLFHPEWVEFKRGVERRLRKQHHGNFSYRPSLEDLLLNPHCQFKAIVGSVYSIQNPDITTKPDLKWSDLTAIAFGKIDPLMP